MALNFTVLNKYKRGWFIFFVAILFMIGVFLVVRKSSRVKKVPTKGVAEIVVVDKKPVIQSYYFHGQIEPIESTALLSPVNGVAQSIYFNYGAQVTKGQKIFMLSSPSLRDKFNQDLDSFLKNKAAFELGERDFKMQKDLYDTGNSTEVALLEQQNNYNGAKLAYDEAKLELEKVLGKVGVDPSKIENFDFDNDQKIKHLFQDKFSKITVVAAKSGVALFPLPTESKDGEQLEKVQVGSDVKEGQLLLSIGDLSGFRANLKVNEIQINKIKVGQPVFITGDAFPGITLKGVVDTVAKQASPNSSSNSSSLFDVSVKAPEVSLVAQKIIHVGMSCQVKLNTQTAPVMLLPIAAVRHTLSGGSVVDLATSSGKKTKSVVTGFTTPSGEIEIVNGLKQGDKVYVYH